MIFGQRTVFLLDSSSAEVGEPGSTELFYSPNGEIKNDMNADFLAVLEFWEREKGISRDVLVQAVEEGWFRPQKRRLAPRGIALRH